MNLTPIAANQTEVETKNARVFFSYRTPVAAYIFGEGFVKPSTWYSGYIKIGHYPNLQRFPNAS